MNDDAMKELRNAAARLDAQGLSFDLLDAQAVKAEEPQITDDVVGGLIVPSHGFVAAGELVRALAASARRNGAQIIEGSHVRRISHVNGQITVETDRGSLSGSAAVLAAGKGGISGGAVPGQPFGIDGDFGGAAQPQVKEGKGEGGFGLIKGKKGNIFFDGGEGFIFLPALGDEFPAVEVDGAWYGDGGIRLTAPLSPAVHLGASRILAVSTRYARSQEEADVLVFNTCTVREKPDQRFAAHLAQAAALKREDPERVIAVGLAAALLFPAVAAADRCRPTEKARPGRAATTTISASPSAWMGSERRPKASAVKAMPPMAVALRTEGSGPTTTTKTNRAPAVAAMRASRDARRARRWERSRSASPPSRSSSSSSVSTPGARRRSRSASRASPTRRSAAWRGSWPTRWRHAGTSSPRAWTSKRPWPSTGSRLERSCPRRR